MTNVSQRATIFRPGMHTNLGLTAACARGGRRRRRRRQGRFRAPPRIPFRADFVSLSPSVRPSVGSPPPRSRMRYAGNAAWPVRRPICRFLTRGHFLASVSFSGRIFGLSDYRLLLIWPTEEEEETEQNSAADSHNTFTAERKIRIRGNEASFKVSYCFNHSCTLPMNHLEYQVLLGQEDTLPIVLVPYFLFVRSRHVQSPIRIAPWAPE